MPIDRRSLLLGSLAAAACATAPRGARTGYDKLLVFTVGYRYAVREQLENALVSRLRGGPTDAIASHILLPPAGDIALVDVERAARGHECDAVLTVQVVSAAGVDATGLQVEARLVRTDRRTVVWTSREQVQPGTEPTEAIGALADSFSIALRAEGLIG